MYEIFAFSIVPLVVLVASIGYALVMTYRLWDWRPLLFIAVLVMMSIHQTNEIIVYLDQGVEAALAGFGEYPETAANVLASLGTVLFLRWIRREQALTRQFEQRVKERTAELESFTYSVSHDLRTPLRAIDGYSKMLRRGWADELDAEGRQLIDRICSSADRMKQLIDDLLTLSRLGRKDMKRTEVDMGTLASEVLEEIEHTYSDSAPAIEIGDLPPAEGDLSMLKQVYSNLLTNAFKFAQNEERPQVEVGARTKDDATVYYVADNGTGFDMDHADQLFDAFQSVHDNGEFEGTGIGLAIAERIVQRHGGEIWAESTAGEGATFYFTLCQSTS